MPNMRLIKEQLKQNKENTNWEKQDWILVKLILDFYESYYKILESPHYTSLRKRVFPMKRLFC